MSNKSQAKKDAQMVRRIKAGKPLHPNCKWVRNTLPKLMLGPVKLKAIQPKPKNLATTTEDAVNYLKEQLGPLPAGPSETEEKAA